MNMKNNNLYNYIKKINEKRNTLFRGKMKHLDLKSKIQNLSGENNHLIIEDNFVYGDFYINEELNLMYIIAPIYSKTWEYLSCITVEVDSIDEFTRIFDKNNYPIFENDYINYNIRSHDTKTKLVFYNVKNCAFSINESSRARANVSIGVAHNKIVVGNKYNANKLNNNWKK